MQRSALEERMRRQFPAWRDLGLAGGNPLVTTFPGQALRTRAMIALNPDFTQEYTTWNWVDITRTSEGASIVRWEQQVSIIYGGRPNSAVVDASTCKFRAANDKRFSRRNPLSPYYGQLSEYTPVWIQLDYGQGWKDRYFGFIHDFSKAWDITGTNAFVDLTARGPFHRIGKSKPLKSPIFRAISGVAADDFKPHGFWAGEDASGSARIGSSLPNQPAVVPVGPVTFGQTGPVGAQSVITVADGFSASFPVVPYEDTDRWAVTWIMKIDSRPSSVETVLLTVHTSGGDLPTWRLILDTTFPDAILRWNAYDASDVLQYDVFFFPSDSTTNDNFFGQWYMLTFGVWHPTSFPGNAQSTMAVDNGTDNRIHATNGSLFAGHVGPIRDFTLSVESALAGIGVALGEFAVFVDPNFRPFNAAAAQANGDALHGYDREPAITRLRRVCREERIPFFSLAIEADSALCGPQTVGTLSNALRVPEAADGGTLYEHKFGLAYKSPMEFQNQAITFTLDAALSEIKDIGSPIDNDLDFVNQWTVSRTGGSSVTVQGRKGEAGVTLADTELVYENSKQVTLADDSQLEDYASRLVAQTTVDEDRWPTIGFKLQATPALIDSWVAFPFGGRINALNVYEEVGVTTLDQIHRGHTEQWNSLIWEGVLNCSPAVSFNALEIDGENSRIDSDSSMLALDITDSATTLVVDTVDEADTWVLTADEPDDFPLDIKLYSGAGAAISSGGETMRIASIQSSVRDTFTRSETNGWGTSDSGHLWVLISGLAAADFSVTGTEARMAINGTNTEYITAVNTGYAAHQRIRVYNRLGVTPTGNPINWGGILRLQNISNLWWIDVQVSTTGILTLRVISKKHGVNVQETTAVSNTVHSTAVRRILEAEITETNLIRAKVYAEGSPVPEAWEIQWQDTSGDLLAGTSVGCIGRLMTGNTNVQPVNVNFDNFAVLMPQSFTVDERATNGIVKAHTAGALVRIDPLSVMG